MKRRNFLAAVCAAVAAPSLLPEKRPAFPPYDAADVYWTAPVEETHTFTIESQGVDVERMVRTIQRLDREQLLEVYWTPAVEKTYSFDPAPNWKSPIL